MSTLSGTTKEVAKVTIEAPVASFRYPHFLIGRQPTFDMPPPSTVYGQVAAVLGDWPSFPVYFAYVFRSRSRGSDLEHQQIIRRFAGRKSVFTEPDPLWKAPAEDRAGRRKKPPKPPLIQTSLEMTVQPNWRDFLFDIHLVLYLEPPGLADAFRCPVFPVTLGRSQDLTTITRVERITLTRLSGGYLEATLLPISYRQHLAWGVTTLMPRYIGPPPDRDAQFEPYIVLHNRVYFGTAGESSPQRLMTIEGQADHDFWVDPTTEEHRGGHRALSFHRVAPGGQAID